MESKYAPAERDPIELIKEDYDFISKIEYVEKLINSLPYLGAILNDKRQVVFANSGLLEMLNLSDIENILGQRAGEILGCIYADTLTGGCGTNRNCSVCGAVNCILEAQRKKQKTVSECRITSVKNGKQKNFDFQVITVPIEWGGKQFYVFSLIDISNEKRRKALEKIFFHDVINKVGSMNGFIDLLKIEKDPARIKQFVNFIDMINIDLIEEIQSQRDLLSAENSELKTVFEDIDSINIVNNVKIQLSRHEVARDKEILVDCNCKSFTLKTDKLLLKRVLTNMLKNALEASSIDEKVIIGCDKEKANCRFWVNNSSVMSENVKLQIFQRSFSTKGKNRGLGTYSIKLLGERYLKGKVGFTSSLPEGTTFYINLPEFVC